MRNGTNSWLKKVIGGAAFLFFLQAGCAQAFSLGETRTFSVDPSYDFASRTQIGASLLQIGDKAFFYVESEWWNSLTTKEAFRQQIANLSAEFDKTIYPKLTAIFGSEWNPGIDNDPRITILISRMRDGTGGYFNSADEFSKSIYPASNEREMIYLNASHLSDRAKSFLAHEFQHLIRFYQKEKLRGLVEDVWLNEAFSEYAGTLCGYDDAYSGSNLEKRVAEFLRNPSDSLTEWSGQTADYGPVNLFMQYLVGRYGEQILYRTARNDAVGIKSINEALAQMGAQETFEDIFSNWVIASYLNDCQSGTGQKYCYLNKSLSFSVLHVGASMSNRIEVRNGNSFSFSDQVKDWTPRWYEFLPDGQGLNLLLEFSGQASGKFKIPYVIFYSDGSKKVEFLEPGSGQAGSRIVRNFGGQVAAVLVAPISQASHGVFTASDPFYKFSLNAEITALEQILNPSPPAPSVAPSPSPAPVYSSPSGLILPDGSLIRAKGDYKIYVIAGRYKRWLQSPAVLACYPHLGWQSVVEVTPEQRDFYEDSWLIRADGDSSVYEINRDLSRHWLNMTAEQFAISGRQWGSVFVVNRQERDLYKNGSMIFFKQ